MPEPRQPGLNPTPPALPPAEAGGPGQQAASLSAATPSTGAGASVSASAWARVARLVTLPLPVTLAFLAWPRIDPTNAAGNLARTSLQLLGPVLLLATLAVLIRALEARLQRRPVLDALDVLTPAAHALVWTSGLLLAAGAHLSMAAPAVLGALGLGLVGAVSLLSALLAGGSDAWRGARVARALLPGVATEDEPVSERIELAGVRIPLGFRLFVDGDRPRRMGPRTRHVVGSGASMAELRLEADLGPARRGQHQLPPLAMWLGDVLGLTRSPAARLGDAQQTVLPRPETVAALPRALGAGGHGLAQVTTSQLPTEGAFNLRAHVDGDEARRIDWMRTLRQQRLIVRLPDEQPEEAPEAAVVLDSHLPGDTGPSGPAGDELLDALVRRWLGVARRLSSDGFRVTLVSAQAGRSGPVPVARPQDGWSGAERRLGAQVTWQNRLGVDALLAHPGSRKALQVVVSARPRPETAGPTTWSQVPMPGPVATPHGDGTWLTLPFPVGTSENRLVASWNAAVERDAAREGRFALARALGVTPVTVPTPRPAAPALPAPSVLDEPAAPSLVALQWLALLMAVATVHTAGLFGRGALGWALLMAAIGGTCLGQLLALRRVRGWAVATLAIISASAADMIFPSTSVAALLPAAMVGGYLALSTRWTLAALGLPLAVAAPWLLAGVTQTVAGTWPLQPGSTAGLLAIGLLSFLTLYVAELRREGLWARRSRRPLAEGARTRVLREQPGLLATRLGLGVSGVAATLGMVGWLSLVPTSLLQPAQERLGSSATALALPVGGLMDLAGMAGVFRPGCDARGCGQGVPQAAPVATPVPELDNHEDPTPAVAPEPARLATLAAAAPVTSWRDRLAGLLGLGALAGALLLAGGLLLRPLRRALVLRHLQRPFWPESRERRVASLWHLALIGLRDAGWLAGPGEGPMQLARRVGDATLARCAERVEQVQQGLPIAAAELLTLEEEAAQGFAGVRTPLRRWARAASWFRWPLVPQR